MVASKISQALLEYAAPLIGSEEEAPTREHVEKALDFAVTVWNAVIFDESEAKTNYLGEARSALSKLPGSEMMFDMMVERKRELFQQDRRLIGNVELVEDANGESNLRASAYVPPNLA